jgi:hypothetical protein
VTLRYSIEGDLAGLRIPRPASPGFSDGLWKRTCCELFVRRPGSPAYEEFNFSPSGAWAAYSFSGYRAGALRLDARIRIAVERSEGSLVLEASVDLNSDQALQAGLSAVVEEADGAMSCWALAHPAAQPDFHHPGSFALELDEVRH